MCKNPKVGAKNSRFLPKEGAKIDFGFFTVFSTKFALIWKKYPSLHDGKAVTGIPSRNFRHKKSTISIIK